MFNNVILAVDAGGTSVGFGLLSKEDLSLASEIFSIPMKSHGTKNEILKVFADIFLKTKLICSEKNLKLEDAAFAVPGPFDCKNGVSYMTHKWKALYKVPLIEEFNKMKVFPTEFNYGFLHDASAFLVGEKYFGKANRFNCVAGITVGTGLGFGLWNKEGLCVTEKGEPLYDLYNRPYQNGILEDYVSGVAIGKNYGKKTGKTVTAKDVAQMAYAGDETAKEEFENMGRILGGELLHIVKGHHVECIAIGGRVSCSYDLFEKTMKSELGAQPFIYPSETLEISAMKGAAVWVANHSKIQCSKKMQIHDEAGRNKQG